MKKQKKRERLSPFKKESKGNNDQESNYMTVDRENIVIEAMVERHQTYHIHSSITKLQRYHC